MAETKYEVTVEGTYYAGTRGNKIPKQFKPEKFLLASLENAQHTIFRKLLTQRLQSKCPDFVHTRTCIIVNTQTVIGVLAKRDIREIPIAEMSLDELNEFTIAQDLDVDMTACGNVMAARKAVQDSFDTKRLQKRQADEAAAAAKKTDDLDQDAASAGDGAGIPGEAATGEDPLKDLE